MQSGFNTNIRYQDVLFHVQTEDSGRSYGHVITHLYHGGTILASEKGSYSDFLAEPDLAARVKELMERQHVAMLDRLRSGELDGSLSERLGPELFAPAADDSASSTGHTRPSAAGTRKPQKTPSRTPTGPTGSEAPAEASPRKPAAIRRAARAGASTAERLASDVDQMALDEMILDYLVETARKRKRPPK